MNKKIKTILISIFLIGIFLVPTMTLATSDTMKGLLEDAAGAEGAGYDVAGTDETTVARIVGTVARIFISLLGVIFISYVIYGGWMWMTAAGNDEKITKATATIRNGVIGLIIVLGAAAIYFAVANFFIYAT